MITLDTLSSLALRTSLALDAQGTPGTFTVTRHPTLFMCTWSGRRHHERDAATALIKALGAEGVAAERIEGVGVRVWKPIAPPAQPTDQAFLDHHEREIECDLDSAAE
jgi:hypothetical protein